MPIATPQGTLDFKSVDTITFVGASSNTVIDTTTGSLGVGVDGNGPTSNLHVVGDALITGNVSDLNIVSNVNMLHTSNTAALKLNSNVVTEFPRSKKLIKYPRVALTSAAETGSGYEGYIVTRSSQFSSYNAWEAFDENNPVGGNTGAGHGWASTIPGTYSVSTGAETGTVQHHSGSVQGEWIQIQLPESIYLHDFVIESRSETTYGADGYDHGYPKSVVLYGSINGSSWVKIRQFTTDLKTFSEAHTENINETTHVYKYFALVVNTTQVVNNTTQISHTAIGQIRLFGTPEYDPDANGVDVKVTSYPNVPNTDWLEVYYDAKNYSGSGDVQDETANNRDAEMNATFDNGEIKAFNFSGAYTSNVTTSDHGLGTGDVTYTMSYWFKRTAVAGTYDYVVMLGDGGVLRSSILMWINNNQLTLDHWNAALRVLEPIVLDQWYHVTAGHSGGNTPNLENDFIYINGKRVTPQITQTAGSFTLAGSKLTLGSEHNGTTEFLNGSIANFRLFNRALTSDEIWQLYAYQKEYFGHGDLGMTLKAGRLGIGTSEPRAALDVRGDLYAPGTIVQVESSTRTNPYTNSGIITPTDVPSLGVTITPKFSTSKVLVSYVVNANSANGHGFLRVKRTQGGSDTFIGLGDAADNRVRCTSYMFGNNGNFLESYSFDFLDSADSTTPITYQLQMWVTSSTYTYRINVSTTDSNDAYFGRTSSSITVKEVCQ